MKKNANNRENQEKSGKRGGIRKKSGKIVKNRQNREGSFTLPLLTDRAGYTTGAQPQSPLCLRSAYVPDLASNLTRCMIVHPYCKDPWSSLKTKCTPMNWFNFVILIAHAKHHGLLGFLQWTKSESRVPWFTQVRDRSVSRLFSNPRQKYMLTLRCTVWYKNQRYFIEAYFSRPPTQSSKFQKLQTIAFTLLNKYDRK